MIMDKILTITEIAKYLRVSRTTVWRWCNEGELPAFKAGHSWRVLRSEVEKIIGCKLEEIEIEIDEDVDIGDENGLIR